MTTDGGTDELQAGDAVVLRFSAELDGLPAMFLPQLAPAMDFDGVSVYADAPEIDDGPPARRTEKLTLVFESGGDFAVPGIDLAFWNTASGRVETATTPGIPLSVAGPPAARESDSDGPPRVDWRWLAVLLAMLLVLIILLRRRGPAWRESVREANRRRIASEAFAFHELRAALRAGRSDDAYRYLVEWTDRLDPPMDSREFVRRYGDDELRVALDNWRAGLFASAAEPGSLATVAARLSRARNRYLTRERSAGRSVLPPLNPS